MIEQVCFPTLPSYLLAPYRAFLKERGLQDEGDAELTVLLLSDERIVGAGSLARNCIKQVAVHPDFLGEGLLNTLISTLVTEAMRQGRTQLFLFTKPALSDAFRSLGFSPLAKTNSMLLSEYPKGGLDRFLGSIPRHDGANGCIVLNGDPLTNGHLRLIRYAAEHSDHLYLFVLSEQGSLFSPEQRLSFVTECIRPFSNVSAHASRTYLVSRVTFPAYFLKEDAKLEAQDDLDLALFCQRIAPALSIRTRFVGEEPFDPATRTYNERMQVRLPESGISVRLLPRTDGISASKVRSLLKEGRLDAVRPLVPEPVYAACLDLFE